VRDSTQAFLNQGSFAPQHVIPWREQMPTGTVKWFNHEKGFGFITPDEAGRDLFVHQSQVEGGGALADGAKVDYESEESDKGPRAVNVRTI